MACYAIGGGRFDEKEMTLARAVFGLLGVHCVVYPDD